MDISFNVFTNAFFSFVSQQVHHQMFPFFTFCFQMSPVNKIQHVHLTAPPGLFALIQLTVSHLTLGKKQRFNQKLLLSKILSDPGVLSTKAANANRLLADALEQVQHEQAVVQQGRRTL